MEGCFTSKTGADGVTLSFKLLTNSDYEEFKDATTFTFWSVWDGSGYVTDAGAENTYVKEESVEEESVEEESVEEPGKKWFESKTAQVAIGVSLSVSTIALLLLL